jgi:hypothetical protein
MDDISTSAGPLFRTMADGRTVFFPFGRWGRGYELNPGPQSEKLRRWYSASYAAAFTMAAGALALAGYLGVLIAFVVWIALYTAWAFYAVRGLKPSDEKFPYRENFIERSRATGAVWLWGATIIGIALAIFAVFDLFWDPENWLSAIYMIVVFSLLAIGCGAMLVMRRKT